MNIGDGISVPDVARRRPVGGRRRWSRPVATARSRGSPPHSRGTGSARRAPDGDTQPFRQGHGTALRLEDAVEVIASGKREGDGRWGGERAGLHQQFEHRSLSQHRRAARPLSQEGSREMDRHCVGRASWSCRGGGASVCGSNRRRECSFGGRLSCSSETTSTTCRDWRPPRATPFRRDTSLSMWRRVVRPRTLVRMAWLVLRRGVEQTPELDFISVAR